VAKPKKTHRMTDSMHLQHLQQPGRKTTR